MQLNERTSGPAVLAGAALPIDPASAAIGWLDSLHSDPLKYFLGLALLATLSALVIITGRFLDMLPKAIEAMERGANAQIVTKEAIDRQTHAVERLQDVIHAVRR